MVLALVVFVVLFAQVLLYPRIADLVERLGATPGLGANTRFLAVEFLAFVVFAGPWGAVSDRVGRRVPFVPPARSPVGSPPSMQCSRCGS